MDKNDILEFAEMIKVRSIQCSSAGRECQPKAD